MVSNVEQHQSQRVSTQPTSARFSTKSRSSTNSSPIHSPKKRSFWQRYKLLLWSLFFAFLSVLSLTIFSCLVFSLNIIPLKYLLIGYGILLVIYVLLFIAFFKRRLKKPLRIAAYVVSALISALLIAASVYLSGANRFIDNIQIGDFDTISYSVLTLKDGDYDEIEDLADKTIGLMQDDNIEKVEQALKEKIPFEPETKLNSNSLAHDLLDQQLDSLCLEQGYLNMLYEENSEFKDTTKIIYTFEIQVPATHAAGNRNPVSEPFIVYISGIDQYGNVETVRGRSDVNQLAIVNPKTHKILLLNTPRDYYVQLPDTTGLKDKLTHAGVYGIDKSIDTLNELYNMDINYYFRVNFDSLINLVDEVGGIDIDSDTDFVAHTDSSVHIVKGINHLNGKQALAFARERYAYATGDRHRGENQQQVIQAIIKKITSSTVILTNYNGILSVLGGTFQTDMPSNYISDFVKMQLDQMPSWDIETYGVDGAGSTEPTYSMGADLPLYVMIPNQETVDIAKQKITAVLEGE